MKKRLLFSLALMIGILAVACSQKGAANSEQRDVIENFLENFYAYEYVEGATACEELTDADCQLIYYNVTPYLSSNSTVWREVIDELVYSPALHSKASINYSTVKLENGKEFTIEDKNLVSFIASVEVEVTPFNSKETYVTVQDIAVNVVNENNKWKIYSLDYMGDDYLFEKKEN
ncbi:MAG: hypothetical protein ACRCST_01755 [Turicibacter sp.]